MSSLIQVNIRYHNEYCQNSKELLLDNDVRVEYDNSKDKMNKKMVNNTIMKNLQ